jgi:DNA-binding response OmpR family regulator
MSDKVLIIEDDDDLLRITGDFLKSDGYEVVTAQDGKSGVDLAVSCNPDLIILDIMLPGLDGIQVCKEVRNISHVPILIVSAKKSDYDKVLALGVGADDYLTKPFSQVELMARVKSHLRRAKVFEGNQQKNAKKVFGNVEIDEGAYEVSIVGDKVDFSPKEFQLLNYLSNHPGQVFSKEQLMNQVWGNDEFLDENTIAVYVGRVREKLSGANKEYIKTVWGVGYRWEN